MIGGFIFLFNKNLEIKGYFLSEKSMEEIINASHIEGWKVISNLSTAGFEDLFINGILSSSDKILIFDILSLFNSLEFNFNRVIGLDSASCGGLGEILNENNINQNPAYRALFETDESSKFKIALQYYLEIRNLIAHSMVRKHDDTNNLVFFSANKKDWSKNVTRRKKELDRFTNRIDSSVVLNEMNENHANFAILGLPFLEYLKELLIPIELHFAKYAAEMTGLDLSK